jgi:hypothetical protein
MALAFLQDESEGQYTWTPVNELFAQLFNHVYDYNHIGELKYISAIETAIAGGNKDVIDLKYTSEESKEWDKNEKEWIDQWKIRSMNSDEVFNDIIKAIKDAGKDKKISKVVLRPKHIYIGKYKFEDVEYPVAIYGNGDKAVMTDAFTKIQVTDASELDDKEKKKSIYCDETYTKYLIIAFYEDGKTDPSMIMQVEKFTGDDSKDKWLKYLNILVESDNITSNPIKSDWQENKDEFTGLMAGTTAEWYETFVGNWQKQGFFANEEAEPLEWLKEHEVKTTSVKFINATVTNIIKEFGMVIHAADSILKTDNPTFYSNVSSKYKGSHSGLYVRYIGGTSSPSNHSIGAAVDFRVPQNPMYTSSNKKHTEFIKYITGVDLLKSKTAESVTNAHNTFMEKFHGKNYGNTAGKQKEILDKYIFIANYDEKGKIALTEIEKIKDNDITIDDFQSNRTTLITALENHKSTIVFSESSKNGIDKLIAHLNTVTDNKIPKLNDSDILAFFTERKAFIVAITNIGFADIKAFHDYFKTTKPFENLLFEHGFCDIDLEVYNAFNKAHKIVSKKLIGKELNVEWGGIYGSVIDGMHFCLNKDLIIELTSKK